MGAVYEKVLAVLKDRRRTWAWLGEEIEAAKGQMGNWKTRGIPAKHHAAIAHALGMSLDELVNPVRNTEVPPSSPSETAAGTVELTDTAWDILDALGELPDKKRQEYRNMIMADAEEYKGFAKEVMERHGVKKGVASASQVAHIKAAPSGGAAKSRKPDPSVDRPKIGKRKQPNK